MKKLFVLTAILGMFLASNVRTFAQEETGQPDSAQLEAVTADDAIPAEEATPADADAPKEDGSLHKVLKEKFIEGGPFFMSFVLIALILGLAFAIERIIYLNLADVNTQKLLTKVEEALENGGVEAAKEVCRSTRGPVASIFYQGLCRADQGIDVVEKSVISYGSVQMGLLERGLTWISLFIALAPMLGFMGTVIGMIGAFDNIQAAGDVNAGLVAGGIKVALITTVSGLIVAMILQVFYNYIVSKVDAMVNEMEDCSISLIDILLKYQNR